MGTGGIGCTLFTCLCRGTYAHAPADRGRERPGGRSRTACAHRRRSPFAEHECLAASDDRWGEPAPWSPTTLYHPVRRWWEGTPVDAPSTLWLGARSPARWPVRLSHEGSCPPSLGPYRATGAGEGASWHLCIPSHSAACTAVMSFARSWPPSLTETAGRFRWTVRPPDRIGEPRGRLSRFGHQPLGPPDVAGASRPTRCAGEQPLHAPCVGTPSPVPDRSPGRSLRRQTDHDSRTPRKARFVTFLLTKPIKQWETFSRL